MATKLGSKSIVKKMFGTKEVLKEVFDGVVVYTNTPPTYPYVTFSSPNTFTIAQAGSTKTWDGILYYSIDAQNWYTWDGTTTLNSSSTGDTKYLYMRGTNNSYITGNTTNRYWVVTGSNVTVSGDIENLLDYQDVENGVHPYAGDYTFAYWLFNNQSIVDCSNLILSCPTVPERGYFNMFNSCGDMLYGPSIISATTIGQNGCNSMFTNCFSMIIGPEELSINGLNSSGFSSMFGSCSALVSPPRIQVEHAADQSMVSMFSNCSSLEDLPKLYFGTFVGSDCCRRMFNNCTKIKISTTQTGEYQNAYLLPTGQTTTGTTPYRQIFNGTGGTYTGDGTAGTTYYTSNDIVY